MVTEQLVDISEKTKKLGTVKKQTKQNKTKKLTQRNV